LAISDTLGGPVNVIFMKGWGSEAQDITTVTLFALPETQGV
jgi:hypothetical protein